MAADTTYLMWLKANRGKQFRSRFRGRIIYEVVGVSFDRTYEDHYGFVRCFVRTLRIDKGSGRSFVFEDFRHRMVEVAGNARV